METKPTFDMAFVSTRSPIPTVELDIDSLPDPNHGWGEIMSRVISRFAQAHPTAKATIYTYFTQSVNFQTLTSSEFFGVAGSCKKSVLKAIYDEFSALPGVRVRYSDDIAAEYPKYHVEGGVAWQPEDAATWLAIDVDQETEGTSDDGWGELVDVRFLESSDESEHSGWPPECAIRFFDSAGNLFLESNDEGLDLADTLMQFWYEPLRAVTIGISTPCDEWMWTESRLQRMESLIKDDLEFDGYFVTTVRCISGNESQSQIVSTPLPGAQEARWALFITDYPQSPIPEGVNNETIEEEREWEEEDEDDWLPPIGESKVQRPRRIRGDALVGTTQSRIEKMLGIPDGSVALCKPDGSHWRADARISTLRKRWED